MGFLFFFFLFPKLKENLVGTEFDRDEKIKSEAAQSQNLNIRVWTELQNLLGVGRNSARLRRKLQMMNNNNTLIKIISFTSTNVCIS